MPHDDKPNDKPTKTKMSQSEYEDEIAFLRNRIVELEADRATQETLIAEQKQRESDLRVRLARGESQ